MTKKLLPKWITNEVSRGSLLGLKSELSKLRNWTDGYNEGKGGGLKTIPGTGPMGGPARALVLINRLLEADNLP